MSSVITPRLERTPSSSSPKSSPTGPTTRTSVNMLAASEKWTAEPPSIRSRSPKGVRTESNATDPTTSSMRRSGPLVPGGQVLLLERGQLVDVDAHGLELQAGDLLVDVLRHDVDLALELVRVLRDVLGAQRLV